jgi:hypothetical protein
MKSELRLVLQETFKGYGKGISLLSSINKGFKFETNALYFILVIIIRCLASSVFKVLFLAKILKKKKFKLKKPKINFIFNAIPTIIIYLVLILVRKFLPEGTKEEIEAEIRFFFVVFMTMTRLIRSFWKLLNLRKRKEKLKIRNEHK